MTETDTDPTTGRVLRTSGPSPHACWAVAVTLTGSAWAFAWMVVSLFRGAPS